MLETVLAFETVAVFFGKIVEDFPVEPCPFDAGHALITASGKVAGAGNIFG